MAVKPHIPPLLQMRVKAAFVHLFGTHSLLVIVLVCLSIIALDWFGQGLMDILYIMGQKVLPDNSMLILKLVFFPFILITWWWWINNTIETVANINVFEHLNPPRYKNLIIFLSLPNPKDREYIKKFLANNKGPLQGNIINDKAFREQLTSGWRMCLEAINYHLQQRTLELVVAVPSATLNTENGQRKGSQEDFPLFKEFIELLTGNITVMHAGDANSERWLQGVDYESAKALRDCLNDVLNFLIEKRGCRQEDILFDITGGQKVCSSVATLISLEAGRKIEYVSTNDYTVRYYDINYGQQR